MKKNEAQQPTIEPILPAANGTVIPSIELLTFAVLFDSCFKEDAVDDESLDAFIDVESSAKTSDDGRKILQQRLYSE